MRLLQGILFTIYASLPFLIRIPSVIAIYRQPYSRQNTILNKPTPKEFSLPSNQLSARNPLIDTCASVNLGLLTEIEPLLGFRLPEKISMDSYYCLCLNDLNLHLDTNTDLTSLATLFGRDAFLTYLQVLIKASSTKQECPQIPRTDQTCRRSDPCQKERGYPAPSTSITQVGDSCVCTASLNGIHGYSSDGPVVTYASQGPKPQATAVNEGNCQTDEAFCHVGGHETAAYGKVGTTVGSCGTGTKCLDPVSVICPSQAIGINCRQIAHVEEVDCVDNLCVVRSCAPGWVPSSRKNICLPQSNRTTLRMRRIKTRDTDITLDVHVVIDLAQLFKSLHDLRHHSEFLYNSSTTVYSSTLHVIDEVCQSTAEIVMSRTLESFLTHIQDLLNIAQRADEVLSDCEFSEISGFNRIKLDVGTIIMLTSDILGWYRASPLGYESPSAISSETPIVISLNRLFGDLGLGGLQTVVKVGGLGSALAGSVNGLLNELVIGPDEDSRGQTAGDSSIDTLLGQLECLVDLVFQLGNLGSLLSLKSNSQVDLGSLAPVSLATLGLMTSTRISGLSSGIDLLVLVSTDAQTALSSCDSCGSAVDKLSLILGAAMVVKTSCEEFSPDEGIILPYPIPTPDSAALQNPPSTLTTHTAGAIRRSSKGEPVVIVLDSLLRNLGLGGTTANMTIGGLDGGLSGMLNGVLALLNAGGKRSIRGGGARTSVIFTDPGLTKAFATAVEGAIDLESKSAGSGPLTTLLAGLMPQVLSALQAVLGSPTITGLISAIDGLLGAAKTMDRALTVCNCTSYPVLESSGKFLAAVEHVRNRIDEHPDVMKTE